MLRRLRHTPGHVTIIAAVSTVVLMLLAVQLREVKLRSDLRVSLGLEQRDDGLFVDDVMADGPGDKAGVIVGDRLLAIDGRPIVEMDDYDAAAGLFERGNPSVFSVERGGTVQALTLAPGVRPDWPTALWTLALVVFCLVCGAVCVAGRTGDLRARLLAMVFYLIAVEFALPQGVSPDSFLRVIAAVSFYLVTGAQAAIELHLASVISGARKGSARRRAFVVGCYATGSSVALIGSLTYLFELVGWQVLPFTVGQVDALIMRGLFPVWAVGVVALLAWAILHATTYRARLQASLVLLGFSPWAVYTLVDWARGYPADVSPLFTNLLPLIVLFYPAAVFVAIFRYRLFDLPLVLRRSLLYTGLTSSVVLVFYAALGAGGAVFSKIVRGEGTSVWSMSLATLVLGLLFSPLRAATRGLIERSLYPERQALRTRLIDLASELPALGKLDLMGQHLVRSLRQIFGTSSATLLLVEPSSGALSRLAQSPSRRGELGKPFFLPPDDPAIARLRDVGRPLAGWDILAASPTLERRLGRRGVELAVPLFRETRLIGILTMGRRISRDRFSAEEIELLSLVAHQVATVLENVRLFQSATYEGLTGLLRREAALGILERELDRAQRYDRPLTVAMADIDHFKEVNDRFGHLEGDRVLRIVAESLQSVIRNSDVVGRYGGEEFLLVFPETDIEAAGDLSEKLRRTVERLEIRADDGTRIEIRISIGMAALPVPEGVHAAEQLIAAADRELYRAKAAGRNRVEPRRPAQDVQGAQDLPASRGATVPLRQPPRGDGGLRIATDTN